MATPSFPLSLYGYLLLMVGSIIMSAVALATPHWVEANNRKHFGLFKSCVDSTCVKYTDMFKTSALDDINTMIGLLIAGLILNGATFLVMAHLVFIRKTQVNTKNHGIVCVAVATLGAILTFAGTARFINEIVNSPLTFYEEFPEWEFGYSMYMGIASGVLALTAGILAVFAVSYFVHCNAPRGLVVQPPFQPTMYGVPVVNAVANPYAVLAPAGTQPAMIAPMGTQPGMVAPMGTQPAMVAPMGTQPAVTGIYTNQGYNVTQAPPPPYK